MKIKQIKINGIRGFGFCKDEHSNEPNPHQIKLDGKHLFLYGENGTGKSSLFDAIELCLTGENPECKTRRIESPETFIRNHFVSPDDIPTSEITFHDNTSFRRELKRGQKPVFIHEEAAEWHFIETSRIEKFVIDTPKNHWERFLVLLGLDDLVKFRNQTDRLKTEAEKSKEQAKEELEKTEKELEAIEGNIQKNENNFLEKLGNSWKELISNSEPQTASTQLEKWKILESRATSLQQSITEFNENQQKLTELETNLQTEREKVASPKVSKLINEAYAYFSDNVDLEKCPVCKEPLKNYFDLTENLKNLKDSYEKITNLESQLVRLTNGIKNLRAKIDEGKPIFISLHSELFPQIAIENNESSINDLIISLFPEIKEQIKRFITQTEPALQQIIGVYNNEKEKLNTNQNQLKTLTKDYELKKAVFEQIEVSFNSYKTKYIDRIQEDLQTISKDEVTKIYNEINQNVNESVDKFDIQPDLENEKITFKAKFAGTDEWKDALSVLSTGHLRCLGFALLITRLTKKDSPLKFIAIDDPIYAIDHEHRYDLIQYFKNLSKTYQLIITTSDRNFFDILQNHFKSQQICSFKTDFSSGSTELVGISNNFIEKAGQHLTLGDYRSASLYARLALETNVINAAKKIRLNVNINDIERIGIKSIVDSQFKTQLIAKYQDRESEINTNFQLLEQHRYFKTLFKGFPLDIEVHFPEDKRGFIYSRVEIQSVITTVQTFTEFINTLR
jgi:energy-coupling factor transporter ATP-binding protein EcfA2